MPTLEVKSLSALKPTHEMIVEATAKTILGKQIKALAFRKPLTRYKVRQELDALRRKATKRLEPANLPAKTVARRVSLFCREVERHPDYQAAQWLAPRGKKKKKGTSNAKTNQH